MYVPVKAEGPDTTRLELEAVQVARGYIQEALRSQNVPSGVLDTLRRALEALEERTDTEPKAKASVKEALASIARHQGDQEARMAQTDARIQRLLASAPSLPRVEELTTKAVERAQRLIKEAVQADKEDATTAALRHKLEVELARGKRR